MMEEGKMEDCLESKEENGISRKEFIKRTAAGLIGIGVVSSFSVNYGYSEKEATRKLGRTGIRVRPVGFGATRSLENGLLRNALEKGINFVDTGRDYFGGKNEEMVGEVVKNARAKVVIQSKLRIRDRAKSIQTVEGAERIRKEIDLLINQSLKALQTDYVDIMMIHGAESADLIYHEAVVQSFEKAKRSGKIRACGFSTHTNQIDLIKANNEKLFYDVIMVTFNHKGSLVHSLTGRYSEWDQPTLIKELQRAEKNNIGIVAMKTCSAGPYAFPGEKTPSFRSAIKWVLNHSFVGTAAVAMGTFEELKENIQVLEKQI
jgi:uncharacterized protein